ncbi:GNAT family N-acetyltransferase [Streptomyces sp. NPDC060194]|uniref:GNAT family N-acetyltransferase n=1 Tax=Streptomyces sp. NPDC060194 TaxID=3347069 RepID=UPI00365CF1A4
MLADLFPPLGLRLYTPRLELRLPSEGQLAELGEVAAGGIHGADDNPFIVQWTGGTPQEVAYSVLRHHWAGLGAWSPREWTLNLTVLREGTVVGMQSLRATDLAVTREVGTTSWLGRAYQGQGIGTEMRAAVLELAFAGLGAEEAVSGALAHNTASLAVSRKLGYLPDGSRRLSVAGRPVREHRVRLTRKRWERHRRVAVAVEGLEPCLPHLGLGG